VALWIDGALVAGTDARVRASCAPLHEFEWTTSAPDGWTYTRSGTWLLVDDADEATLASYGANAWGGEMHADGARYAPIVPGYTNLVTAPRDLASWTGADARVTADAATSPDGTTSADRFNQTTTTAGIGRQPSTTAGTTYTITAWLRARTGTAQYQLYVGGATATEFGFAQGTASTAWRRVRITRTIADNNVTLGLNDTRAFAGVFSGYGPDDVTPAAWVNGPATDCYHDAALWIPSRYVRPFTATTVGNPVLARAGSRVVAPNGRFDVLITNGVLKHREAAAAQTSDGYLLYLDANNHFRFRASDHKYVLTLGGSAVAASAAKAYAADHDIGYTRVWSRGNGCGFTVDGATVEAAAAAAVTPPATAYLFSNNGSNVFPCDVQLARGARFRALHPA
jgi:hypothetical protein